MFDEPNFVFFTINDKIKSISNNHRGENNGGIIQKEHSSIM